MKLFHYLSIIVFMVGVLLTSCVGNVPQKRIVTVTVLPQKYFAEKIAGVGKYTRNAGITVSVI